MSRRCNNEEERKRTAVVTDLSMRNNQTDDYCWGRFSRRFGDRGGEGKSFLILCTNEQEHPKRTCSAKWLIIAGDNLAEDLELEVVKARSFFSFPISCTDEQDHPKRNELREGKDDPEEVDGNPESEMATS